MQLTSYPLPANFIDYFSVHVSLIPKIVDMRGPTERRASVTIEDRQSDGKSSSRWARVSSLDRSNRFVEMLKGYGIPVNFDQKTHLPIITDSMILQLEKKLKGKITDYIDLKPGVKITEKSPIKEREKVKENGVFMTQYDGQSGFPRLTKDLYNKFKNSNTVISKDKVEQEVSKINAPFIKALEEYKVEVETLKESERVANIPNIRHPHAQSISKNQAVTAESKPPLSRPEKKIDLAVTFGGSVNKHPSKVLPSEHRNSGVLKEVDRMKLLNEQNNNKEKDSVPLPNLRPTDRSRQKGQSSQMTKRTWRVMSAKRVERGSTPTTDRGNTSINSGYNTSIQVKLY